MQEVKIGMSNKTLAEAQKGKGWEEAFQEMAKNDNDELLIPDVFEDEDLHDWT